MNPAARRRLDRILAHEARGGLAAVHGAKWPCEPAAGFDRRGPLCRSRDSSTNISSNLTRVARSDEVCASVGRDRNHMPRSVSKLKSGGRDLPTELHARIAAFENLPALYATPAAPSGSATQTPSNP